MFGSQVACHGTCRTDLNQIPEFHDLLASVFDISGFARHEHLLQLFADLVKFRHPSSVINLAIFLAFQGGTVITSTFGISSVGVYLSGAVAILDMVERWGSKSESHPCAG